MNRLKSRKFSNPDWWIVFCCISIPAFTLFHSVQYLPNTPKLFWIVASSRVITAMAMAMGVTVLFAIAKKMMQKHGNLGRFSQPSFWKVFFTFTALAIAAMTIVSWNNQVSDGLLHLYLP